MADWLDGLTPAEREQWDAIVDHTRAELIPKLAGSALVMSMVPKGPTDVKFALELGMSVMLDKPIVALIAPGGGCPPKLCQVADLVIEADPDTSEGQQAIAAALKTFMGRLPDA